MTCNKDESKPWHASFPEPKAKADIMPRNRVMQMLSLRGVASILIIDLRRMDFEGGCLRGSLNIPAQGFFWNRGMLYELAYKADIEWVIFTCGSSNGRAPRCAAWFKEFVEAAGDEQMQSMVLEGGVKGWVKSGPQFTRLMDGYKETYWQNLFVQEEENEAKKTVTAQGNSSSEQGDKNIAVGQGDVTQ